MSSPFHPTYTIFKKLGETPLEALEHLRAEEGISADVPLAYAGRLDPMATGTLLILVGDECKEQERYHRLDKEYIFEVLCGAASDTGDVLGLIKRAADPDPTVEIARVCDSLIGKISLPYPHFSSKTVKGKPLHTWTLENRLDEITIPSKESVVYKLDHMETYTLSASALIERASQMISSIPRVTDPKKALGADFRRHEVRGSWQGLYYDDPDRTYSVHRFRCIASSGTYMRSLAERIGAGLGSSALALSIERTRIGRYRGIPGYLGFWTKTF